MRNILKIASLLDYFGQYNLSDKLFKIAQVKVQPISKETIQGFLAESEGDNEGINMTSDAQREADNFQAQRFFLMNTSDPAAFAKSLFQFGSVNGINNLTQAFDAYADAGASYQGNLIKNVPILRELYMRVRNTPRPINQKELVEELTMLSNPQATMQNPANMRKEMTAGQAYVVFTQLINNSRSIQELEQYKKEIHDFDGNKFDQTDKTNLFKLIEDKSKLLNANSNQENNAQYTEYTELVNTEPLAGLETLKTEIENNQYLNQNQKTNLINIINQRIMNRR
jgi:hypothetical protein